MEEACKEYIRVVGSARSDVGSHSQCSRCRAKFLIYVAERNETGRVPERRVGLLHQSDIQGGTTRANA